MLHEIGAPFFLGRNAWEAEALVDEFLRTTYSSRALSVSEAIRVGRMLEENDYFHFEEPCPCPEIELTARVADALYIAVSGGGHDTTPAGSGWGIEIEPSFLSRATARERKFG